MRGSVAEMISLTPVWLKPLNPSLRSRFSRCEPIAPCSQELLGLFAGDQPRIEKLLHAFLAHLPPLSLGERLSQVGEIRKRLHDLHAVVFKLLPQRIEIEHRFEVMHAGLQESNRRAIRTKDRPSPVNFARPAHRG